MAMRIRDPLPVSIQALFNGNAGYSSYVVPAVLILILQQTLLIGISILGGVRPNRHLPVQFGRTEPDVSLPVRWIGRGLAYFFHYCLLFAFYQLVVYHIFDFGEFSSRTVGPRWKEFSAAQKKSFSNAFADLLLTTYLNKVDGYNGEQVAYTGEIANAAKTRVEVRTEITMKDGTRVPVAYRMMAKDNSWRVYDIIVENLSLVKNYRTQFQDILTSGTPDELIARVKAKAEEVRKQPVGK